MKTVHICKNSGPESPTLTVEYCTSFWGQFKGLMFRKKISDSDGLLLVEDGDSILNSSIHMLFMFFDIAVFWINSDFIVVDKALAKKWHPFYFPHSPAKYVLECHPSQLNLFSIKDRLSFIHVP